MLLAQRSGRKNPEVLSEVLDALAGWRSAQSPAARFHPTSARRDGRPLSRYSAKRNFARTPEPRG
ncbi:MAG: hypothetical protein LC775_18390, partial [Acidobacteria bacterium]|nr:hypothetical protein [Acidobacteriota bacterium]